MRLGTACKAFWRILRDADAARKVSTLLQPEEPTVKPAERKRRPGRNDALNVLAALQREARLVDFLNESLDAYSDAQIGTAVRDIHRDAGAAIQRMFGIGPVLDQPENAAVEVPKGYSPNRYKLTGTLEGEPPYRGTLCHHGWQAAHCEVPEWHGDEDGRMCIAPAEVQVNNK